MSRSANLVVASIYTFLGLISTPSFAANRLSVLASTAVGVCQPALPTFDGNIRKRPLAIQNEGASVAFVTCSFPTDATAVSTVGAFIRFDNSMAVAQTVTCTLVQGISGVTSGMSITKSLTLPATTRGLPLQWAQGDNGGNMLERVASASCSLPEGTAITYVAFQFNVDIGS